MIRISSSIFVIIALIAVITAIISQIEQVQGIQDWRKVDTNMSLSEMLQKGRAAIKEIQAQHDKSLGILNKNNIDSVIATQKRMINIAKLHHQNISQLETIDMLLYCVSSFLNLNNYQTCDDSVTNMIVNHELGNNQTMIRVATDYLKSRGIQ